MYCWNTIVVCCCCCLELSQFFAELSSDKEEEEGVELDSLPCYLPGLMGCRNVESYEWLNRIEEGTYGVVHRAKDKKTGVCGIGWSGRHVSCWLVRVSYRGQRGRGIS